MLMMPLRCCFLFRYHVERVYFAECYARRYDITLLDVDDYADCRLRLDMALRSFTPSDADAYFRRDTLRHAVIDIDYAVLCCCRHEDAYRCLRLFIIFFFFS